MENLGTKENLFKSFEEQFSEKQLVNVLDGKIEAVDIKPDILKNEVPVLFAPGWGENQKVFKDSLKEVYGKDRRALSLTRSGYGGREELMDSKLKNQYPVDELRKAFALLAVLEEKNIDKIDVVAHSEGGINTAIAASIAPEKFRSIVFMNTGGLIGKDNFPKLAGRFSVSLMKDASKVFFGGDLRQSMRLLRGGLEVSKSMFKNPVRALNEAVAISKSDITGLLKDLHEKGIGIAVVNGVDDPVFPMDKMQKMVKADTIDGFVSVKGGHNEIYSNPEKYTAAALELLDSLEKKKNKVE